MRTHSRLACRPGVEPLAARLVPATLAAHAALVHEVALGGTVRTIGQFTPEALTITGSGTVNPVGKAALHTTIRIVNPSRNLVLSTPRGNLDLTEATPVDFAWHNTAAYTITGGTGIYKQASGSGTITLTVSNPSLVTSRAVVSVRFS